MSLPVLTKYHKEPYPYISPTRPELSQVGNTVVVAGGSTGIGLAIARGFTKAGASRVIILGRRKQVVEEAAATLQQEGSSPNPSTIVEGRSVDISNLEDVSKLWSKLEAEGVYVNVLVLSAAAFGNRTPILEDGLENVWSNFEINVRTALDLTERFYKQKTGKGQKYLVNVSTIAAYMWSTMAPERPSYGLTKNASTLLVQQIAKDTAPEDMQIVSFHPGGVLTEAARKQGMNEDSGIRHDDANLSGHFAVWAATKEARFLHGRFVWANWDMDEVKNGVVGKQIQEDEHFLKVGIEGLTEKTGGAIF